MQRRGNRGFTLVELITVMVLAGLLVVGAVSLAPGRQIDLSIEARRLAAAIRYTQLLSMARWQRFRINFSATGYRITTLDGTAAIIDPGQLATQVTLPTGMTLRGLSLLVFNSQGVPYATTNLPGTSLTSTQQEVLSAGGQRRILTISPITGRVLIS